MQPVSCILFFKDMTVGTLQKLAVLVMSPGPHVALSCRPGFKSRLCHFEPTGSPLWVLFKNRAHNSACFLSLCAGDTGGCTEGIRHRVRTPLYTKTPCHHLTLSRFLWTSLASRPTWIMCCVDSGGLGFQRWREQWRLLGSLWGRGEKGTARALPHPQPLHLHLIYIRL